jgi:hypothetical protein
MFARTYPDKMDHSAWILNDRELPLSLTQLPHAFGCDDWRQLLQTGHMTPDKAAYETEKADLRSALSLPPGLAAGFNRSANERN